jgi:hypothetical protein
MKKFVPFLTILALAGILLVGCEKKDDLDSAAPPPGPGARPADVPPPGAASQLPAAPGPAGGPGVGAAGAGAMAGPK